MASRTRIGACEPRPRNWLCFAMLAAPGLLLHIFASTSLLLEVAVVIGGHLLLAVRAAVLALWEGARPHFVTLGDLSSRAFLRRLFRSK